MKVLAVDPGEKRIGLAISDPTGTIARPLMVLKHVSREKNAERIVEIAKNESVGLIIVGQALDSDGQVGPQARKSQRLAEALSNSGVCAVELWDESGTTQAARQSQILLGVPRKRRQGHLDDIAASILLQDYLNINEPCIKTGKENDGKN